ncbi:MAG TPA: hypothetical protein VM715_04665 [Candidatus Acidoferrum sp.]|nr:hypothetical protein [Candidatus Acidoferrum sp.]
MAVYNPTGMQNVHIDVALTQISIGFPTTGLVADRLTPAVPVGRISDKYYVFPREGWFPEDDIRAPGTEANEIPGLHVSTDTYYAQEHALQIPVTWEEREEADNPITPDQDATELVTSKILLGREITIKNLVTTVANYATGMSATLSGTAQWNDFANSNPIGDVKGGRIAIHNQIFLDPNMMIIPWQVMIVLEDHPDFIERIKYSERGIVSQELISALFQIPEVVVPGTGIQTSAAGQAVTLGYLWAKDIVMAYVPARPGQKIPAFAYEFVWGYPGAGAQAVERWSEIRRKSDLVRVGRRYDVKMTAVDASNKSIAGYVIKSAVA